MPRLIDITGKAISGEWGDDDETGNGIPVLRTTNFTNDGFINFNNTVTRTINKKNIDNKYLKKGDIIIEKSGGSDKQPVGRVVYFDAEENKYLFNNFTGVLRVKDPSTYYPRFIFYVLFYNYLKGGTIPFQNKTTGLHNLKTDDYVNRVEIPLFPYKQQQIFVAALDKVQAIISYRKQQLAKLDELVKARFVEMFGDIYTNQHNYPIQQFSDYIDFLTSGSRGWAKYCVDDGLEWFITIKNVKDCCINVDNIQSINAPNNLEAKRTRVEEGDLLISITADLGRTGVVTKDIAEHGAYINQHLTCIRLDKSALNPLYVAYFMESNSGRPQFEAKNQTGVKSGLNFDSIKTLKLLIPSLELQNQFSDFVEQINKSKVAVQKALDEAQLLFDSLMQEYFG